NLVNTRELRAEYEQQGKIFCTTTDTEVIANVIADEVRTSDHLEDAVLLCMRRLQGSYSVVLMVNDTLYAFRDPLGIKPLCIGRTEHGHIVASESVAMDALGAEFIRDVKPGEMIRIDADGIECAQIAVANHRAHCIFEYVYFARADSVIDGTLVYDVRRCIGRKLHENDLLEADIVSPVPDSGTAYAVGYAEASGMPFLEGLMKNRYMGRTFIMPTQRQRENAVRIKLNPIRSNILEKKVVLIDDSIVRGTTSRRIVDMIREAGAAEVHVRVGSPPIIAPCYLGVDMPTREELIASGRGEEAVRESISATTLNYVSLDALVEAIGIDAADLCTGCLTGYYPLSISGERCCPRVIDFVGGTYQSNLESFGPDQAGSSGDSLQYTTIAGKWVQNE
ncbi:MAG: amidophosphoribosyltransferase, partial [Methanomicrobiaceae archaeon]|nr:amidophosphoribosyltransferase [Methanomicrobiaceae archaeon]